MLNITYAGHSTIFLEYQDQKIIIDPWLETNPLCPNNLKNPDKLSAIILSHGHADHSADAVRLAKEYGCKVFATYELAMLLQAEGVPAQNICPMNKGGSLTLGSLTVALTHAMHSSSYDTTSGAKYAGEACGIIVQSTKGTLYHAGDTALFSDMELIAEFYKPDIACIPIGDCFTMGPKQAVKAVEFLGVSKVIPIHHSTFPQLTGTPDEFSMLLKSARINCEVIALAPNQSYVLEP